MTATILKIDEAIFESDKIICRQIGHLSDNSRGEVSQEILESLRHFVEHILLKIYANDADIDDTQENISAAVKFAKADSSLKHFSRFHYYLQVSVSHRVIKEQNAERLMLKYYEYLIRIRTFMHKNYSIDLLANLEQFPLDTDDSLAEYYQKIAEKINENSNLTDNKSHYDRFYIEKIKPFFC